jgi:hypothetical protein
MYINHPDPPVHMLSLPKLPRYIQKILPGNEDMRTAVYYIACLVVMTSMICIAEVVQHPNTERTVTVAAIFSVYCNLAMHCSGILFGIVIARMAQADKEEAARAESLKENLI